VQPRQLDDGAILIGCEDLGLVRLEVTKQHNQWSATPRWKSRAMRPAFNDFVVCGDSIYGFDESIFCCVDTATGKRRWKAGRYGHGQVLLIADQKLLLIVSETVPPRGPRAVEATHAARWRQSCDCGAKWQSEF
jgi:outer membrane protein assembly factor BamB